MLKVVANAYEMLDAGEQAELTRLYVLSEHL